MEFAHVVFREMGSEEIEEILDLEDEIFGRSIFIEISLLPVHKKVLIADVGEIAGFAIVYWDENGFYLGALGVKEKYRGKGIGKELVKKCVEFAKKKGYNKVWLEVNVDNKKAIEIYKNMGFRIEETIRHFYGIGKHAYKMVYVEN
ncbi:MAG: GNAT family N-acetyltransferase [Archaeoglobaceae archaeon]|nr:GNAT family N-acetyltransferase [Archaeoglobaceae archaeon]